MCENYPTEEIFQKEILKNYILNLSCEKVIYGTSGFFVFNLVIPDPTLLNENKLEEAIAFLHEVVYHPKVDKNGFDKFELEREKKNLRTNILNKSKNLRGYLSSRLREIVDETGVLSCNLENHLEQLNDINSKNLYEFYCNTIASKVPLSFVIGNVNGHEIKKLFSKYFYQESKKVTFSKNYFHYLKPSKKVKEITEEKPFKQSALTLAYKIENMKVQDRLTLSVIKNLLASQSSSLLLKKLRTEHALVYSTDVVTRSLYGEIELIAYIDPKKKEIVKEKMLEVIEDLKKEDKIKTLLQNIKDRNRINLERQKDNKSQLLDDIIDDYLGIDINANANYQELLKITTKEIKELVNRFVLDTIYFVKETSNEK